MQSVTYVPCASSHLLLQSCLIIPSSDMKGEECPQFLLTSAGANTTCAFVDHCSMSSAVQITILCRTEGHHCFTDFIDLEAKKISVKCITMYYDFKKN